MFYCIAVVNMEPKPCESNFEDLLSSSGITCKGHSLIQFFVSSVGGTILGNTASIKTLTQTPVFPTLEVAFDSWKRIIAYLGKGHNECALEEWSHQVKEPLWNRSLWFFLWASWWLLFVFPDERSKENKLTLFIHCAQEVTDVTVVHFLNKVYFPPKCVPKGEQV